MLNKNVLLVFLFVFANKFLFAQTHEWAFDINSSAASSVTIRAQAVDDSGNVYIGGVYRDSLYLPKDTFYFASSSQLTFFVAKYNKDGDYIWGKSFTDVKSANIAQIVINSQNQIILYGNYSQSSSSSITFGSYTLTKTAAIFVAFLNSSGSFTFARDLAYGYYTYPDKIVLGTDNTVHATYYLNGFGSSWTINDSVSPQSGSGYVNVIAKYSSDTKKLLWQKNYNTSDVPLLPAIAVDRNNQVYYSLVAEPSKTILGTSTGSTRKIFLVWLRPNGAVKDVLVSSNTNYSANIQHLAAVDSNAVYFAGSTRGDSITIANTTIKSTSSNPSLSFYFVAELKGFNTISWYRSTSHTSINKSQMLINGDYLYFSSVQNSNGFSFAGFSRSGFVATVVSKFDRLGNLLWYLPINSSSAPLLSPISNQDLLYSGGFASQIILPPFTLKNARSSQKPFVAKTFDYSITRGEVFPGPYCAGDTLFVPYIAAGKYDTSNVFTAELSDEKGDFFGGQQTLGSLKFNKDSVVLGKLPLFKVASSKKYRIRITSSTPTVQSYYQLDTLNLLIYSTDKADPGKDTSICFGDTLMLKTYGGTQWKWSPNYAMNDSTLRTPLVYPTQDTTYTIIISDSSGCGAPDTADIRVKIKVSPNFTFSEQSDTIVCKGKDAKFKVELAYGIGEYYVEWRNVSGGRIKLSKLNSKVDSIVIPINSDLSLFATVTDSCSSLIDTVYFDVKINENMQFVSKPSDTAICNGQLLLARYNLKNVQPKTLTYKWFEKGNATAFSTDSFINQTFKKDLTIRTEIYNSCSKETLSHEFAIKINPSIQAKINGAVSSDSFCSGSALNLKAGSSGGNPLNSQRAYYWLFLNKKLNSDSFTIQTDSLLAANPNQRDYTVYLVADDKCTVPMDTTSYSFYVFPKLQLDTISGLDTVLCLGNNMVLKAGASGGKSNNWSFEWKYLSKTIGNTSSLTIWADSFKSNQQHTLIAQIIDGCSLRDSVKVQFSRPDSLKVAINSNLNNQVLCVNNPGVFKTNARGGIAKNYRFSWKVNNQLTSTFDSLNLNWAPHAGFTDSLIKVSVQLDDGCAIPLAKDSIIVRIKPIPIVSFKNDSMVRYQIYDTILCRGQSMRIKSSVFYSNQSAASLQWFLNGISVAQGDIFDFTPYYQSNNLDNYRLVCYSNDVCSNVQDSSILNIQLRGPLSLDVSLSANDTTICHGSNVKVSAFAAGGWMNGYNFKWQNLADNSILGTDSILSLNNNTQNKAIKVTLSDGCTLLSDSISFNINILPALSVSLSSDSICSAIAIKIKANASGGQKAAHQYTWFIDNVILANSLDSVQVLPTQLTQIKVVLSDYCSSKNDTAYLNIAPIPNFNLSNLDSVICEPYLPNWQANASNNESYTYMVYSVAENKNFALNSLLQYMAGNYVWKVISYNTLGCTDTVTVTTKVKPLPDSDFTWSPDEPSTQNSEVIFTPNQTGASNYSWYMGGELKSNTFQFVYDFSKVDVYTIQLKVIQDGCTSETEKQLKLIDAYQKLDVNSFSPNGDGLNDLFTPYIKGTTSMEFAIFNRWGELVFRSSNGEHWDGNYKNTIVPQGVYIVLVSVRDANLKQYNYKSLLHVVY